MLSFNKQGRKPGPIHENKHDRTYLLTETYSTLKDAGASHSHIDTMIKQGNFYDVKFLTELRRSVFPTGVDLIVCQWCLHMFTDNSQKSILRLWSDILLKPNCRICFTTNPTPTIIFGIQIYDSTQSEVEEERCIWANSADCCEVLSCGKNITRLGFDDFNRDYQTYPAHSPLTTIHSSGDKHTRTPTGFRDSTEDVACDLNKIWLEGDKGIRGHGAKEKARQAMEHVVGARLATGYRQKNLYLNFKDMGCYVRMQRILPSVVQTASSR